MTSQPSQPAVALPLSMEELERMRADTARALERTRGELARIEALIRARGSSLALHARPGAEEHLDPPGGDPSLFDLPASRAPRAEDL